MKRRFFKSLLFYLSMLSAVCVTGCGGDTPEGPEKPDSEVPMPDETENPQEVLPIPGVSFTSITLPNEGDTFACHIYGLNAGEWSAESNQAWCEVSTQGNILKITALPSHEPVMRLASVTLLHSDKRPIGNIEIKQSSLWFNETLDARALAKQTFFPMFTATWCPFSPGMDKTLVEIQKRWKYTILPMRIHVKESELYCPLSDGLSELYNNWTTPTGYFENYFRVDNMADANISIDYFWNLVMAMTAPDTAYPNKCSYIECSSKMTDDNIEAEVTVRAAEAGIYRLLVFVLEDNIIKPQMHETDGEISDYCHNGVLVGALTTMKGQELELSEKTKVISLKSAIPSNTNKSNLRLLIVLESDAEQLNFSDNCWYADNCISVPLGKVSSNSVTENIYIGDEIEN